MCVIERKTYYHTNGSKETVEKARPCHRAVGDRLCKNVDRRSFEAARVEERKPSSSSNPPENERDGYILIEGSRGQTRLYRDLSKRSSNSSSIRRSATMSDRTTPVSTPSSASSPSYVEVKPEAPEPPSAATGFPFGERTRTPYSSAKPGKPSFTKDGTAIYDRPPSLDQPRAFNNERPRSSQLEKESSFSSTTAEVDDADNEPTLPSSSDRRHKPKVSIDTTTSSNTRPGTSSSSTSAPFSSPGLSTLKPALRRDSGKDIDRKASTSRKHHHTDSDRQRRKDDKDEAARQARIERDRLAGSDRRQSVREERAREASRERHRKEAAEALEGARDAERAEMERERERNAQLRREDEMRNQYYDDQMRRDAEARARRDSQAQSSRERYSIRPPPPQQQYTPPPPQYSTRNSSSTSPVSTRSNAITSARAFLSPTSQPQPSSSLQPMIHQEDPPQQQQQSITTRGQDIIARERARQAGESLNEALGGLSLDPREREAEAYQREMDGRRYRGDGRRYR